MPEVILDDETPEVPGIKRSKLKREVDTKAAEMRERLTLPPVPAFEMNDKQWTEYARLLTPDMWTQISNMYLYRISPKIILQLVDPTNKYKNIDNLNRIAEVREHILKLHGGGKYKLSVSRSKKKGEEQLCEVFIDIPIAQVDPILDYRTLDLSSSDNTGYITSLKARGIIDDRGNPMQHNQPQQQGQAITGQDMVGMFREFLTMFARMKSDDQAAVAAKLNESGGLGNQIGAILLEKMKQDSPATLVTGMSGMLSAAKEIMGERKDNGSNTEFLKILLEQQKSTTEMMARHSEQMLGLVKEMKTPKEEGTNLLDSVESAMSIMERLDSLRGGGGKRGIGDYILEGVEKVGLPLLSHVTRIYEINKLGKAMTPEPARPNPTTTPALTGKTISGMQAAANAAKAEQGKMPPKAQVDGEAIVPDIVEDQEMIQLMQVLQGTGGIIVQYMNDDRSGADLALWVIEGYKKVTYSMVAGMGEEKLFLAIRNFPELWGQLERFGEPAVRTFVHEFCHYEEFLEDEQGVPEPEEPKRGRNKK